MAKSRKRKSSKSLQSNIKYELYGIVILILSAIALNNEGTVAHSLTYMFRFVLGRLDWVIPVYFMYLAVHTMMRREWPKTWTRRKSGVLLFVLGLAIMNHIRLFSRLHPLGDYSAGGIWFETWAAMFDGLDQSFGGTGLEPGGGMVGATLYSVLYFLFDDWGARLIQYTLFILGILLVTGKSYVELIRRTRETIGYVLGRLGIRVREMANAGPQGHIVTRKPQVAKKAVPISDDFDDEVMARPKRKKPMFFQLLDKPKQAEAADEEEHGSHARETVYTADEGEVGHTGAPWAIDEDDELAPVIHDFAERAAEAPAPGAAQDSMAAAKPAAVEHAAEPADGGDGAAHQPAKPAPRPYQLPPLSLLSRPQSASKSGESTDYKANARKLEATLESFGVRAKVLEIVRGPSVTRYEIQPDVGVKVSRIVSLTDDIALALAAKDIRMEAPIPGKAAIGIEVPNSEVSIVTLREVMESGAFHESSSKVTIVLGRDISGQPIVANLARMPHMLVAGATGSGKSVCINGVITSILYKAKPDEVKFLMIDPKMVELNVYNGIPHLLAPVVTDPRRASLALKKIVVEMEKRYELFSKSGTRNMEGYNNLQRQNNQPTLPFIVVIVDELADLMMVAAGDVEDAITRLAQMARAAGIHLIIATQRPSVDVITGVIKANIPSRIAFGVSSQVDSRTILDGVGAEKLLGRGDMLFLPVGASKPLRVQGAFLSDEEVEAVVGYSRSQGQAEYREELVPELDESGEKDEIELDELYDQAVQIVVEAKQASVSLLQRRMRVGYTRAARLIDTMEAKGIVGPYEGSKPREVLWTLEMLERSRISS